MFPVSNLLKLALSVVGTQTVQYQAVTSRRLNDVGLWVPCYGAMVPRSGSFQPVPHERYNQMGLDLTRAYAMWYDPSGNIEDLERDTAGDRLQFNGEFYQVLAESDWKRVNGWAGAMCVKVPDCE